MLLTFIINIFVQVYKKLVEKTKFTPGAQVENNKFCVSVHFRRVDETVRYFSFLLILYYSCKLNKTNNLFINRQNWSDLAHQVRSVMKDYPKLRLTQGRKVRYSNNYLFIRV